MGQTLSAALIFAATNSDAPEHGASSRGAAPAAVSSARRQQLRTYSTAAMPGPQTRSPCIAARTGRSAEYGAWPECSDGAHEPAAEWSALAVKPSSSTPKADESQTSPMRSLSSDVTPGEVANAEEAPDLRLVGYCKATGGADGSVRRRRE